MFISNFFIGATKRFEMSRMFMYGLTDFFRKGQRTKGLRVKERARLKRKRRINTETD